MTAIPLSEQIGAMAHIDDLRHRQLAVQEHLNLPARRQDVAKLLRVYYDSQNIVVDDGLIEQGIRQYFARRLAYEAPPLGRIEQRLALLYISRSRWLRKFVLSLTAAVTVTVGGAYALAVMDDNQTYQVVQQVEAERNAMGVLIARLQQNTRRIDEIGATLDTHPLPAGARLLNKGHALLKEATLGLGLPALTAPVSADNRETIVTELAARKPALDKVNDLLQQSTSLIDRAIRLIQLNAQLAERINQPDFFDLSVRHPVLLRAVGDAQESIERGDTEEMAVIEDRVAQVDRLTKAVDEVAALTAPFEATKAHFAAMSLKPDERARVAALATAFSAAAVKLQVTQAQQALDDMQQLETYAAAALVFNVVDRAGVKSGVERNYNPSGGKSWYLITEALDSAGKPVAVPVTSVETGAQRFATTFGIRVAQAEYDRVKADKLADGHVDDKLIGRKPADSLSVAYTPRTSSQPDMILEW